jgi:hypothetical protein
MLQLVARMSEAKSGSGLSVRTTHPRISPGYAGLIRATYCSTQTSCIHGLPKIRRESPVGQEDRGDPFPIFELVSWRDDRGSERVETLTNVAMMRAPARSVPRKLPATFERPPLRRR